MSITKTFTHESDFYVDIKNVGYCRKFEVTIWINATVEDDFDFDIQSIHCIETNQEFKLEQFPKDEQNQIEEYAEKLASKHSYEAYEDFLQVEGERMYDYWKENRED